MLNNIWISMVILAVIPGGINGKIENVTKSAIDSAGSAATAVYFGAVGVKKTGMRSYRGLRVMLSALLQPLPFAD